MPPPRRPSGFRHGMLSDVWLSGALTRSLLVTRGVGHLGTDAQSPSCPLCLCAHSLGPFLMAGLSSAPEPRDPSTCVGLCVQLFPPRAWGGSTRSSRPSEALCRQPWPPVQREVRVRSQTPPGALAWPGGARHRLPLRSAFVLEPGLCPHDRRLCAPRTDSPAPAGSHREHAM